MTYISLGYRPAANNGPVSFNGHVIGRFKPTPSQYNILVRPEPKTDYGRLIERREWTDRHSPLVEP